MRLETFFTLTLPSRAATVVASGATRATKSAAAAAMAAWPLSTLNREFFRAATMNRASPADDLDDRRSPAARGVEGILQNPGGCPGREVHDGVVSEKRLRSGVLPGLEKIPDGNGVPRAGEARCRRIRASRRQRGRAPRSISPRQLRRRRRVPAGAGAQGRSRANRRVQPARAPSRELERRVNPMRTTSFEREAASLVRATLPEPTRASPRSATRRYREIDGVDGRVVGIDSSSPVSGSGNPRRNRASC